MMLDDFTAPEILNLKAKVAIPFIRLKHGVSSVRSKGLHKSIATCYIHAEIVSYSHQVKSAAYQVQPKVVCSLLNWNKKYLKTGKKNYLVEN